MLKAERRKENSAELPDYNLTFWRAGDSLLFLFKSAETAPSAEYRRISYLTGIVSEKKSSDLPCSGSFRFKGVRDTGRQVSLPLRLCFHAPRADHELSGCTFFSPLGSVTIATFLERSLRLLLRLFSCGGVSGDSPKTRRPVLVDTRLSKRRESAGVIGKGLLCFDVCSYTTSCTGRKCLHTTPTRRWEQSLARAPIVRFFSERL